MIYITVVIAFILLICTAILLYLVNSKISAKNRIEITESLYDILANRGFYAKNIVYVNKHLSLAVDKVYLNIGIIQNFNPKNPLTFNFFKINTNFITKLEKTKLSSKMHYVFQGESAVLEIFPNSNEVLEFLNTVYKQINVRRMHDKFIDCNFIINTSSNWQCDYIWGYDPIKAIFAYFQTNQKDKILKMSLRREFFTLDAEHNYLMLPVYGMLQQLFIYEKKFLSELYLSFMQMVKRKAGMISLNTLYYDNFSDILYISNGTSSIQTVLMEALEEIYYFDNKISFKIKDETNLIDYYVDSSVIEEVKEFIIGYNLRKISQNFDYKSDKLINATDNTKFIIDHSRRRLVYCANLNRLASFNYFSISFSNVENAYCEKSGNTNFVRIHTKENEIIDVTCNKYEVAEYIMAQLLNLVES